MSPRPWSYKRAGIDIDKHRVMHQAAIEAALATIRAVGLSAEGLGGYASSFILDGHRLTLHVDGVGTKTLVLEATGQLWVAGWDCVAMNVNDVAVAGYRPLVLVDYIAMPSSNEEAFIEIIRGLREAALEARVALVGGETAILPDLARGYDVVCAVLGRRVNGEYSGRARPGDVLLGVPSSGLHANGYSLARKVVEESLGGYKVEYQGLDLGKELSKPTYIYSNLVLEAIEKGLVTAAAHITGGGFMKLARILGEGLCAEIEAPPPPRVFQAIMELGGIEPAEMYRVFNMGIGLVMATSEDKMDELVETVHRHGFSPFILGRIVKGLPRIVIETPWGDRVEYKV